MVFFGLMRAAIQAWVSGGIIRSFAETWYQLGLLFQAGTPDLSSKQRPAIGFLRNRHNQGFALVKVLAKAFTKGFLRDP